MLILSYQSNCIAQKNLEKEAGQKKSVTQYLTDEKKFEEKNKVNRYKLRKILYDVLPESYILEHQTISDILYYTTSHLNDRLFIERIYNVTADSYWKDRITANLPIWNYISIYNNTGSAYKYYPITSGKNIIYNFGIDSRFIEQQRFGIMLTYAKTNIKKLSNLQAEKIKKEEYLSTLRYSNFNSVIGSLYYQYLQQLISIDIGLMIGKIKEIRNINIKTINEKHKLDYMTTVVGGGVKINYPYYINNFYFEVDLQNIFTMIVMPDVIIEGISSTDKTTTKAITIGTGICSAYKVYLNKNSNLYYSLGFSYNYNFYLEGYSKIDITYFNKNIHIDNYLLEHHSFNTNLSFNLKIDKYLNIGINLIWTKKNILAL